MIGLFTKQKKEGWLDREETRLLPYKNLCSNLCPSTYGKKSNIVVETISCDMIILVFTYLEINVWEV